jgi:ABC-type branched-subunit amino acid transport system ATPase component
MRPENAHYRLSSHRRGIKLKYCEKGLNKGARLTVLLVEQKVPFVRRVASEFCILGKGRRFAARSIGELPDEEARAHLSV